MYTKAMREPAVPNIPPPSGQRTLMELPGWFLGVFNRLGELDHQIGELEARRSGLRAEQRNLTMVIGCYLSNELGPDATSFPQSWVKVGPLTVEIRPPLEVIPGPDLFDADLMARLGVPGDVITQFLLTRKRMQEGASEVG